jgi:hypothetical protein
MLYGMWEIKKPRKGPGAALTKCLCSEDAVTVVIETLAGVEANKRRNRARTLLQGLLTSGHLLSGLEGDDGWVWLPS